jgi:hypothetical protein
MFLCERNPTGKIWRAFLFAAAILFLLPAAARAAEDSKMTGLARHPLRPATTTCTGGMMLGAGDGGDLLVTGKCIVAAVAWKQPNGFYYPPAFHSVNLFFDNVSIRHYVIEPLFKPGTFQTDPTLTAPTIATGIRRSSMDLRTWTARLNWTMTTAR